MFDLKSRFNATLKDTVEEWKKHEKVKGIFVYGSFVRGTITSTSDLDLLVIWKESEAPVQLVSEHMAVRVDMLFKPAKLVDDILDGKVDDVLQVAELVEILRNAQVVFDADGSLKNWKKRVADFAWSEDAIETMKSRVELSLTSALRNAESEDTISAIHDLRTGLFDLGRVIVMKNNCFSIMKPSEILTEIRLLDPLAYQLFIRTFKLRGLEEDDLMVILQEIEQWIGIALERVGDGTADEYVMELLTRVQRGHHGATNCTFAGDFELAVLEMRRAIDDLGKVLIALTGKFDVDQTSFIQELKESEPVYYETILVQFGAFDFTAKGVLRGVSEARFIAQRL
ncbi:MAG: nucleotidyltransferase domain-containing protein [Candidatus Thorarchaeota archaeon]|nr:nucleotidyltransferase domain-containing protein [Candidatus Thorarchaeota archaeon]